MTPLAQWAEWERSHTGAKAVKNKKLRQQEIMRGRIKHKRILNDSEDAETSD